MTSLLTDSLTFLSSQLDLCEHDIDECVKNIRDRAFTLRSCSSQDSTSIQFVEPVPAVEMDDELNLNIGGSQASHSGDSFIPGRTQQCNQDRFRSTLPPIPSFPGVDQDSLRNLLMSWFYAGYYTAKSEMSKDSKRAD